MEDEVIDRLFALNAERAAEEKALGAATATSAKRAAKSKPTKPRRKKQPVGAQLPLGEQGATDE